jgi:hypothetical protein
MTTKKREYLAANIRAGYTVQEAAKIITDNYKIAKVAGYQVCVISGSHGRDVNGNGTAHYIVHLDAIDKAGTVHNVLRIVESGKRREQVGYSGQNEAALYALSKLGFEVDTSKAGSYDYPGTAFYPLLNFPPKAVQS